MGSCVWSTIGVQYGVQHCVCSACSDVVSCYNVVSCSRYFYVAHRTGLEMMLHGALVSSSMFSIWTAILSFLFWVQCRIHTQVTTMSAGQTFGELALLQKWWTQHENILSLSCHCAHFADARRRLMKSHFSGWMYMQLYAHPACDMYMYIYTTCDNHIIYIICNYMHKYTYKYMNK